MENDTIKNNPAIMTIICNIQNMSEIIGSKIQFKELENLKYKELMKIQDDLIRLYNIHIKDMQV